MSIVDHKKRIDDARAALADAADNLDRARAQHEAASAAAAAARLAYQDVREAAWKAFSEQNPGDERLVARSYEPSGNGLLYYQQVALRGRQGGNQ